MVEDEFFIAIHLCRSLESEGAKVLGPAGRVDDALDLISQSDQIDGALLDLNLHGLMSYPVADALLERSVPFVFVTGYDSAAIPERFEKVPHCQKPITVEVARTMLFG